MSSNSWVNYGIAAAGAIVVGFATFGAGLSWYIPAALFTFSATASILNAMYARPQLGNVKGLGAGTFGQQQTNNGRDAAAQALQIASASEAIAIPVIFGTERVSTNYLRYDRSTFRSVPIIERVQRDPSLVAYEQAKAAYKRNPSRVDHELDSAAAKQQEAQNQGGKGGQKSPPPPSETASDYEKVNGYTQILLQKDQEGKRKLPIEYDEYVVGYKYFLSYELGICMGPVDRLERVRSYPGEGTVIDNSATPDVTGANSYAFTARGQEEGGAVRFYPGKLDQVRETGDLYKTAWTNYRGVCFAMLTDFFIGTSPSPRSYAFEITRFPVCLDADGNVLADFPVRGATAGTTTAIISTAWANGIRTFTVASHPLSQGQRVSLEGFVPATLNGWYTVTGTTPTTFTVAGGNPGPVTTQGLVRATHPSYFDANPAAVLYEIFTNPRWGRGMSPDDIDIESFRTAAQYFEANNIGMSFSLETQNVVSDACEIIRNHVSTLVIPVAGVLRCICLLDRSSAYTPVITLTSENVSSPTMTRPGWVSTVNELRGEFRNRLNNFQNEIVLHHDDGNLATTGRINSMKLSLPAFSNRDTADRMTKMLLHQMAIPQGSLKLTMNRFESRLEPGMFVAFVWSEWSEGATTTYWRVVEISDADQDQEGLQVTLIEDPYATPVEGLADTFEPPVPAFEDGVSNDDPDVYLGEPVDEPFDSGDLLFQVFELPIFLSDGEKIAALFANRNSGRLAGVSLYAREDGSSADFTALGLLSPWSTFAELENEIPAGHPLSWPTQPAQIELALEDADKRAILLEICSLAPTADDDVTPMMGAETNWVLIGNEIFQVAQAEAGVADNQVVLTVFFRGQLGTDQEAHSIGDRAIFFFEFIPRVHTFRYGNLPINVPLEFRAISYDTRGDTGLTYEWTHTITNRARRAMAIEEWDTTGTAGTSWAVSFRPRFHNRGSQTNSQLDADINTQTGEIPDLYDFWVMPQTAGNVDLLTDPVKVTATLAPEDGEDPATGMISFTYAAPVTTDHLIFYQAYDGVLGYPVTLTPP